MAVESIPVIKAKLTRVITDLPKKIKATRLQNCLTSFTDRVNNNVVVRIASSALIAKG